MKVEYRIVPITYNVKYICFLFFFILSFNTTAQNYLMKDQHSSFHTGVQISYNTFENHYAVLPGYTFNGRLTVGFDIGKTKDLVNKINSTVFRPNVSLLILKQNNDELPISFDLNLGYQYNYVSQIIFNVRSVQFGGGIYHEISPLENVKIIPAVLFEGNKITSGPNAQFQQSVVLSYGVQTSIVWNKYYLTPKFQVTDGISTISVKLGLIFSSFVEEE